VTYFHKNCNVDLLLLTENIRVFCVGSVNIQKCCSRRNCLNYV
jgi:hypothetical protein